MTHDHDDDQRCAMCESDMSTEEFLRDMDAKIKKGIAECGWFAISVGADGDGPGWTYTIGLRDRGWPEIIVWALSPLIAHKLLGAAIAEWEKAGGPPADGAVTTELANMPTAYRHLPQSEDLDEIMQQAWNYYATPAAQPHMDAVQMVWPDPQEKFPWDPECDPNMASWQSYVVDWRPAGRSAMLH
jgi:hypothetical protein